MKRLFLSLVLAVILVSQVCAQRMVQPLGRGVVVAKAGGNALISWRRLAQDPEDATYNVYVRAKGGSWTCLNTQPTKATCLSVTATKVPADSEVGVAMVTSQGEQMSSIPFVVGQHAWNNVVLDVDFETTVLNPADYRAKYAWPADLDGDGEMEYVVDRLSTESFTTRSHKLQAYDRTGRCLWTVDMGPNVDICVGQNDMVTVADVDLDGRAEVIVRSSDGTRFWDKANNTWGLYANGSTKADVDGDGIVSYSTQNQRNAPYYCSVIDGQTGAEKAFAELDYTQAVSGNDRWTRNNRANYMDFEYATMVGHFAVAYFDGVHPSVVQECQTRTTDGAHHTYVFVFNYNFDANDKATNWHHAATSTGKGSSFHQVRVADMDGDGCDEMVQGGYWINPLQNKWMSTNLAHGDRFRVSDIDPSHPGMEVYAIQQNALLGQTIYDARTGEHLYDWYLPATGDVGRGECMDVDPAHKGYEIYSTMGNLYDCKGNIITQGETSYPYEGIWWDGDLAREALSSPGGSGWGTNAMITKYDGTRLIQFSRESDWQVMCGTGVRPLFWGDIMGDWREEVVIAKQNNDMSKGFVVYATAVPTTQSFYTLLQDPHYLGDTSTRGYYQSPNTSFYLGYGMPMPPLPPVMKTTVHYEGGAWTAQLADNRTLMFDLRSPNQQPIALSGEVKPDTVFFMSPRNHNFVVEGEGSIGGSAPIWKSQQGEVTLNTNLTTSGTIYISEGTLRVNGSIAGSVDLRARGTLAGNATLQGDLHLEGALNNEGGRLQPGAKDGELGVITLQKGLEVNKLMYIECNVDDTQTELTDRVIVQGDLTLSAPLVFTIKLHSSNLLPGRYPLLTYTGELKGELNQVEVEGITGLSYNIEDADKTLTLVVNTQRQATKDVQWTGTESAVWDYQTHNFQLNGSSTDFVAQDTVVFSDLAERTVISVPQQMPVGGITLDNDTKALTFQGEGGIAGEGNLVKMGQGTVNMKLAGNTYTGATLLREGTLTVTTLANGGQPSSLGAASSLPINLQLGQATLDIASVSAATDRGILLTDSATIRVVQGSATFLGMVQGKGGLTKTGSGQLTLSYPGTTTYTGGTTLRGGTLAQGAWNTTFGSAGSALRVTANSNLNIFNNNTTSAVPRLNNAVTIARGVTLTINPGQRCVLQGSLLGQGTLKLAFPYVRGDFAMNASQFEGTLQPTGGQMRLSQALNMPQGIYAPGAGVYTAGVKSQSGNEQSYTHTLGALKSTATDASFGTGIWNVGQLGTACEFAGSFNSGATLNKVGEGTLTLTGQSQASIHVREGIVALNASAAATTTGLVTVYQGALLCGTGRSASVRVQGRGTLGAGRATGSVCGTLTLTGTLTVQQGGQLRVRARSTSTVDKFNVAGKITLQSPVFVVDRQSGEWTEGTEYKIFTGEGSITLTGTPTFQPAQPAEGLEWDISRLATEGILMVKATTDGIERTTVSGTLDAYDLQGFRTDGRKCIVVTKGKKILRR